MRRRGSKLKLLFKGLKGRASIPCDDLQPPNRRSRNKHPMHFKDHMLELKFTNTVSSQTLLGIGMHSLHLSSAESSEDPIARFTTCGI